MMANPPHAIRNMARPPGVWGSVPRGPAGVYCAAFARFREASLTDPSSPPAAAMNLLPLVLPVALVACLPLAASDDQPWVVLEGKDGPGKGKHVVLISGDQEYRSEETIPQLAKILATRHGFKCTVLFTVDKTDGTINPTVNNIPGLDALQSADLMVIFTRFLDLPDDQMAHVAA